MIYIDDAHQDATLNIAIAWERLKMAQRTTADRERPANVTIVV
jgi:hypothetical protein